MPSGANCSKLLHEHEKKDGDILLLLEGIKVVDFSQLVAGPLCGQLIGDLGADVVKIEPAGTGDNGRNFAPYKNGVSGMFAANNRNKRSITLNLKEDQAKEIAYQLVKGADVVIENYSTGVAEKLGVDYDTLKRINPNIIYASISGFGRTGPYRYKGGYDMLGQAFGGTISVTGPSPDAPPSKVGFSITDVTTGLMGAMGILAALLYRNKTGEGQRIDVDLLRTSIEFASYFITNFTFDGVVPKPKGTKYHSLSPYQAYKAKDGYIIIGTSNNGQWERMLTWEPLSHLSLPKYADLPDRVKNDAELTIDLEDVFKNYSIKEIGTVMDDLRVPSSPINTIKDLVEDDYVRNELLVTYKDKEAGDILSGGLPFKSNKINLEIRYPAPQMGEHNEEVLQSLGYSESDIKELKEKAII